MKKRILLVVIALVLALACLTACVDNGGTYSTINKLLEVDYSKVIVDVTTDINGVELTGKYILTFDGDVTNIKFDYEELNELSFDGDNSGFKKPISGTAVVRNGVVISSSQEADLNTAQLNFTGLSFKPAYFKNVTATSKEFEADVVSVSGFLGASQLNASNMRVKVEYFSAAIVQININYLSSEGAEVSISYKFSV